MKAKSIKASVVQGANQLPVIIERERPSPRSFDVLVKVEACAVCRTDLHVLDGDLQSPKYPLVLGHEIVGTIEETGDQVEQFRVGDRIGIPWLAST
jgi:propanol-preferring alcohol dehydrogenase